MVFIDFKGSIQSELTFKSDRFEMLYVGSNKVLLMWNTWETQVTIDFMVNTPPNKVLDKVDNTSKNAFALNDQGLGQDWNGEPQPPTQR